MTDERDESSRGKESVGRNTARDVPLVRGAGADSEPAPRGQRPAQLPRDPTYEAELAQVELAVLRDPERRDDPSTKQGGGRRGHEYTPGHAPESVTPESPGAHAREVALGRSPDPPSSGGRAVASGTLLSVGAVDPRGKTERTLETPRMFFSRPDEGAEAYFKPGKIPAVTVHQTLETETVKLSDSVDPRRAKTIPRMDRADLARLDALRSEPDSEAPVARSDPQSSLDLPASDAEPRWNQDDYEPASSLGEDDRNDGQIHASLSAFRDQREPSFSLGGVPTRPEPFVQRRGSEPPPSLPAPDTSTIPTQRDLPMHRIEASRPPPAPAAAPESVSRARLDSAAPFSEVAGPTTASIAAVEAERRPAWLNYAAFGVALLVAVALGLWLTSGPSAPQASPSPPPEKHAEPALTPTPAIADQVAPPAERAAPPAPTVSPRIAPAPAAPVARKEGAAVSPKSLTPSTAPVVPPPAAPHKSVPPKSSRETIF